MKNFLTTPWSYLHTKRECLSDAEYSEAFFNATNRYGQHSTHLTKILIGATILVVVSTVFLFWS